MRILTVILLLLIGGMVHAQQPATDGEMVVLQNKPLHFSFTQAEDFLLPQIISNAFELKVRSSSTTGMNVYAHVVFNNAAARANLTNQLALRMSYKSSSNAVVANVETSLSNTPVLLFNQPVNRTGLPQQNSFIFDLKLKPLVNFISPDSYNYSIVFTISPE